MGIFTGTPWDRPPRCQRCGELAATCRCAPLPRSDRDFELPPKQNVRVSIERRKKGKCVTIVAGLAMHDNDLAAMLTQLKTACGAGGTLKGDVLEIQGSHCSQVQRLLTSIGYQVACAPQK